MYLIYYFMPNFLSISECCPVMPAIHEEKVISNNNNNNINKIYM